VQDGVAEMMQPLKRGVFNNGFGELSHDESHELQEIWRRIQAAFAHRFG
jgi:hypothetical protein